MPIESTVDEGSSWITDYFQTTPIMSTYLLAFVIADFRSREKDDNGFRIRIWAQPDMYDQTSYALEFASKTYRFFADYFGRPEIVPKADHVAVPDFSAGAMENWGLVLYREIALLHDEEVSSISNKYWVSLIQAHEIAHTWFGNMVTMEWWDDLWLNEGFANTLMYFALDDIYPNWKVFDLQVVGNVFPVMTKDSLLTSHPISAPINHPDDITQYFDSISYDKGMAVLRLLRGFLGWDDFRRGLQNYVNKYIFSNAKMKDLWKTFEEAVDQKHEVAEIMDTWTRQMGFPVVTVKKIGKNKYRLDQSRFLLNPEDKYDKNSSPYQNTYTVHKTITVPRGIHTQSTKQSPSQQEYIHSPQNSHRPNKNTYTVHKTVTVQTATIHAPDGSWILGNIDYMGFYRTNYDEDMWRRLADQLHRDHTVFPTANRAGLISDAFNLARQWDATDWWHAAEVASNLGDSGKVSLLWQLQKFSAAKSITKRD
ncbi:hypothetical protein LSH36_297g02026 [Paralvinella palmiformis]|uniref:Aminopeptidase N n=1 Tax=Paralvinella palmiformis TaxID=53620 RepID=A0AAD9JJN7_9ANNE|nr:hypothetical protein LSH36_297g02026 [Paralvinella palmiformis]